MSYDLYCYQSPSNSPSFEEAQAIISSDEADAEATWPAHLRVQIVEALIACNPRLERIGLAPASLHTVESRSEEAIGSIELNPPEGDLVIQIYITGNHVFFAIPYWYRGDEARQTFSQLLRYAQTLRDQFDFFAFDPQTGEAFDPSNLDSLDHTLYEKTVRSIPSLVASGLPTRKKPWWKFWQ